MGVRRTHDGAYAQAMLGVPLQRRTILGVVGPQQPALDVLS